MQKHRFFSYHRFRQPRNLLLAALLLVPLTLTILYIALTSRSETGTPLDSDAAEKLGPLSSKEIDSLLDSLRNANSTFSQSNRIGQSLSSQVDQNPIFQSVAGQIRDLRRWLVNQPKNESPLNAASAYTPPKSPNPDLIPRAVELLPSQQKTLSRLRWRSGKHVNYRARPHNRTIRFLSGERLESKADSARNGLTIEETTAFNFLRNARDLLLISNPDTEFQIARTSRDRLGFTQIKFEQSFKGLEIWPASATIQLNKGGNVDLWTSAYIPTPRAVDPNPYLTREDAVDIARSVVNQPTETSVTDNTLIIYVPVGAPPRLSYRIALHESLLTHWMVVIDATDGTVLTHYNQVCTDSAAGSGVDLAGQIRPLNLWFEDGLYYVVDTTKPMYEPVTSDPPYPGSTIGGIIVIDADNVAELTRETPLYYISSASNTSGFEPAAVSAALNLSNAYDFFFQILGRNSIDDNGGTIVAVVNVNQSNASWIEDLILLGNQLPNAHATDVVAHEFTHGVIQASTGLIYRTQSGALNESFADIFGESVEAFSNAGEHDWLLGTGLGETFRDMRFPEEYGQPARMSDYIFTDGDNGGVHSNSGIINRAFYLLADGLDGAIGIADSQRIFYRALTTKLHPLSDFVDCRFACVQAAREIFGANSNQMVKTAMAFDAVEIFDQIPPGAPSPVTPVDAGDSFLFTAESFFGYQELRRRDTALGDPAGGIPISSYSLAPGRRPSVSGDGAVAAFVTSEFDMAAIEPSTGLEGSLGFPGAVHSVAISPDANVIGFILRDELGNPIDQIYVAEFESEEEFIYDLLAPTLDGDATATVLRADALAFSPDGRFLFYDALNRINYADGNSDDAFSMYVIDRNTGSTFSILEPDSRFDVGNPALGQSLVQLLTFEAVSWVDDVSVVVNLDLLTAGVDSPAIVDVSEGLAFPSFNGDDSALIYTEHIPELIFFHQPVIRRVPLTSNGLSQNGSVETVISDAREGVVYRSGTYHGLPKLSVASEVSQTDENSPTGASILISLVNQAASDIPFRFVLTGTARNGTDYQTLPLSSMIASGQSSTRITFHPEDDLLLEGAETATLTLLNELHYTSVDASASVMILDNDTLSYDTWAATNGYGLAAEDPDKDRLPNLLEYALGGDPQIPHSDEISFLALIPFENEQYLVIRFNRSQIMPGIEYVVEVSDNFHDWNSGPSFTTVLVDTESALIVQDSTPITTARQRAMRLRVIRE